MSTRREFLAGMASISVSGFATAAIGSRELMPIKQIAAQDTIPDVANRAITTVSLLDFVDKVKIPHATVRNGTNTKDLSSSFQSAVNRIKTLGGGVLDCRGLHVYTTAAIDILGANNLTLLADQAQFSTAGGDHFTFQNGARDFATDLTYYAMTGTYTPGDTSVILKTASDAKHFSAGDYVYIRASQDVFRLKAQPIAEINKVMSVNRATGVVVFAWPLTKDYAAYSTYPYGLAVANSLVTENVKIVGGRYNNSGRRAFALNHVVNTHLRPELITGRGGPSMRGRFVSCEDARIDIIPNWGGPVWRPYFWAVDTGTTDSSFRRNICTSTGTGIVHLQEGQGNASVEDNTFESGTTDAAAAETWPVISLRGRSWETHIRNNRIINCAKADAIYIAGSSIEKSKGHCNADVSFNSISGTVPGQGIRWVDANATNARIIGNNIEAYNTIALSVRFTGGVIADNIVPAAGVVALAPGNKVTGNVNF